MGQEQADKCRQCGGPLEDARKEWATPVCFACVPPPKSLPGRALYRCDVDACGVDRWSTTNLRIYGTCRVCNVGTMRRVEAPR